MATGQQLYVIDTRNPKDILIQGLKLKIQEQGDLRVGFDVTSDYPSRETFEHDLEEHRRIKRRIVVKKLNNVIHTPAIGHVIAGEFDYENFKVNETYGWVDQYIMEISVWSPDSTDRDNIVELIKLWMLELEQEIQAGYLQLPFLFSKDMFSIKFVRSYEDTSYDFLQNGPMYIGSLVYESLIPFYHESQAELQRYKINLISNINSSITSEVQNNGGTQ